MKAIESLKSRLLDIEPPMVPAEAIDYTTPISLLIVSLTIIIISYFAYKKSRFAYRYSLLKLKNMLLSSDISPKEAAYQLALLLSVIHKANPLRNQTVSTSQPIQQRWDDFLSRLSSCRYQSRDLKKDEVLTLINESKSWLKAAP